MNMKKRFYQAIVVAVFGSLMVIPLTYFFIKIVFETSSLFAAQCVAIGLALTLPVAVIQAVRTYKQINREPESLPVLGPNQRAWRSRGLLFRVAIAVIGGVLSAEGTVTIVSNRVELGAFMTLVGLVMVVGAMIGIVRLTRDPSP